MVIYYKWDEMDGNLLQMEWDVGWDVGWDVWWDVGWDVGWDGW